MDQNPRRSPRICTPGKWKARRYSNTKQVQIDSKTLVPKEANLCRALSGKAQGMDIL